MTRKRTALTIAGGALAVGLQLWPSAPAWLQWRCPFHLLTGLDCPGCGGTRAVRALLTGDMAGAFRSNAFVLLLLAAACVWLVAALRRRIGSGRFPALSFHPAILYTLLAIAGAFTVYRNLPTLQSALH